MLRPKSTHSHDLALIGTWFLGWSVLATGCASVPPFHPGISEATSMSEALYRCGQYSASHPIERPIALEPFTSCVDEARDRFLKGGRDDPDSELASQFMIFDQELRLEYGLL